ncbi:hypothetical protein [Pseudoxanthomonas wuyuanensis]|uniref:FdhD protein n=1 Tax=Pseudoxanthomonas wuyuanensis TaxID=1073196 RepID=A0A286DCF1_9GAMM|nr:hypothetical protein [Pseudoxanthomonas wuyuanensis]KAF1719340.1 hypothetical protein CSC75_15960 [Pseudoxanthomonas wuyuanensis]SOD56289.1 hypothetical protein SAMN06296416_10958 [Pseudoxanthomonas wuyuanensis]
MSADPLAQAVLAELARHAEGVSLSRLCKRLDVRMSALLRALAWLGEDAIGGTPGPGWVQLETDGARTTARLTERGRSALAARSPVANQ